MNHSPEMKYTLVTGASGFIGRALVKTLSGSRPIVAMSRRTVDLDVEAVTGEFHSVEDLRRLDSYEIGSVVHLAAVTGGCSEEDGIEINVQGTRRLIRYLLDRGCMKFVLASSVAAVGCLDNDFVPREVPIPDDHLCLARDAYGLSKAMMEEVSGYFARQHIGSEFINLRFGAVVDDAIWQPEAYTGAAPPPYPFVMLARVMLSDVLGAVQAALLAPTRPGSHIYNVVGPDASCADRVAAVLRAAIDGRPLDLSWYEKAGHEHDAIYSMKKIAAELGFTPRQSLR